jgi:hypothetical protein
MQLIPLNLDYIKPQAVKLDGFVINVINKLNNIIIL